MAGKAGMPPKVFRVTRDEKNRYWSVFEDGFEKPLASFDLKEDAVQYGTDLVDVSTNATLAVED